MPVWMCHVWNGSVWGKILFAVHVNINHESLVNVELFNV